MRHRNKARKLGRPFQPRMALLRNLVISLFQYEKICTTEAKAKEVKRIVDGLVVEAQKRDLSSRRKLLSFMYNDARVVEKVFSYLLPRFSAEQQGGFSRIIKIGPRKGDNAPLVQLELVFSS